MYIKVLYLSIRVARGLIIGSGTIDYLEQQLNINNVVIVNWRSRRSVNRESIDTISISINATYRLYLFNQYYLKGYY